MEIALVHTTGSPSRHDSDSDPSYDRKRQSKSSSEMALHRKQSRRVSEVYSVFMYQPRHSAYRAASTFVIRLSQDSV